MTSKLFEVLSRKYANCDKSIDYVFVHRYWSKKINAFKVDRYKDRKRIMRSLCKKANLPFFNFHQIRHAGASALAKAGVPIIDIKTILGHENIKTTEIYLHSIGSSTREAVKTYESYRENSLANSLAKCDEVYVN